MTKMVRVFFMLMHFLYHLDWNLDKNAFIGFVLFIRSYWICYNKHLNFNFILMNLFELKVMFCEKSLKNRFEINFDFPFLSRMKENIHIYKTRQAHT